MSQSTRFKAAITWIAIGLVTSATAITKTDLIFPLGIQAGMPIDSFPWEVYTRYSTDNEDSTISFENGVDRVIGPSKMDGDLKIGSIPVWVDRLTFLKAGAQWVPGQLTLVTEQVPEHPEYATPSTEMCKHVQSQITELATYYESKYKDSRTEAPGIQGFFSGECKVLKANDTTKAWHLRKKGMTVSVRSEYEYRNGQFQVLVDYTSAAYQKMRQDTITARTQRSMAALDSILAPTPSLGLPFGKPLDMQPDSLPWSVLDRDTSEEGDRIGIWFAERSRDNIEVRGLPNFFPHEIIYRKQGDKWKLESFTMSADQLRELTPYDCSPVVRYQRTIAQVLSKRYLDKGAKVDSSKTYGSEDCRVLRFDSTLSRWQIERNGVEAAVVFEFREYNRRDYLQIIYTVK